MGACFHLPGVICDNCRLHYGSVTAQHPQIIYWPISGSSAVPQTGGCRYCGPHIMHSGMCPKIEEIEYYQNGTVKRVKLRG